jgi:hypothetical protein
MSIHLLRQLLSAVAEPCKVFAQLKGAKAGSGASEPCDAETETSSDQLAQRIARVCKILVSLDPVVTTS